MGNRHPSIAPYETLRCKEGILAVCRGNDGQFRRLAEALRAPELADDERFATNPARVENRDHLVQALETRLANDTVDSWAERLTAAGVAAGKVGDFADGVVLAESLGLEPTVSVGESAPPQIRHPITYSADPSQGPHRGRRLTPAGLRTIFRYHRARAYVPAAHPHALRHSYVISALAESGVDLAVIQALLGHAHVDSSVGYIHLAPVRVPAAYDAARARQRAQG